MSLDKPTTASFDASNSRFAIIAARYNESLVNALVSNAEKTLNQHGHFEPTTIRVPGSAELPIAAKIIADRNEYDAIIVIGVVIAGDTNHHNIIGDSTAIALQQISIDSATPILNGILVTNTREQAEIRSTGEINRGKEFAEAAMEMATFSKQWKKTHQ